MFYTTLAILLAFAIILYGGATAYMYTQQDRLVFPRTINIVSNNSPLAKPFTLAMEDGTLLQGAIYNESAAQNPSSTLVLLFGGNAHDVAGFVNFWGTDILPPQSNVVVAGMAYRGYRTFLTPASGGMPSQNDLHADALNVVNQLIARYQPARVTLVGYSLGSAIAARLAFDLEQAGTPASYLVMLSPFTSMTDVARHHYRYLPVGPLMKYPLNTAAFFADIQQTPIALLYTSGDTLVPPSQPKKLKEINPKADLVDLPDTTHVDLLYHPHLPPLLRHAAGLQ